VKYGLNREEIAFIEKIVRPMDLSSNLVNEVAIDDEDDA
jgi:site-specific DNA-methyltransferase (adenine-specific)